ncbi:hypothetical protein Q1695_015440 [Nippostrongylus brasiliensis]|nr:hypothetical protein Q1695_015440 [Nippostrongylus brasiliensis]
MGAVRSKLLNWYQSCRRKPPANLPVLRYSFDSFTVDELSLLMKKHVPDGVCSDADYKERGVANVLDADSLFITEAANSKQTSLNKQETENFRIIRVDSYEDELYLRTMEMQTLQMNAGLLYERYRYPAVEQATQPDESGESEGSDDAARAKAGSVPSVSHSGQRKQSPYLATPKKSLARLTPKRMISAAAKPSQSQSDSDLPAEEAYNEKPSIREPPSTELCPSLPTSVTMPPIPADKHGEDLQRLSETEWETGEQAFPNEFINLNREEDRISVYAAPEKTTEHLLKLEEKRRKKLMEMLKRPEPPSSSESSGTIETFTELVDAITMMLNEDRTQNEGVKIHISAKVIKPDGSTYQATTITAD